MKNNHNNMENLYKEIRLDILTKIRDLDFPIEDLAYSLSIKIEEFNKYISLEKTDYLMYRKIYSVIDSKLD